MITHCQNSLSQKSTPGEDNTQTQSVDHCEGAVVEIPSTPIHSSPAPPPLPEVIECTLQFDEKDLATFSQVDPDTRQLNGIARPPPGYSLAVPFRMSYTEVLIREHLLATKTQVATRQSYISMVLSLAHLVVGSYELYLSWANEIPRWGYASYGLSVIPYLLMSACNFICAAYVGSYPCGQLLRTPILDESLARFSSAQSPLYDGTIGTPKRFDSNMTRDEAGLIQSDEYVAVEMHMDPGTFGPDGQRQHLVVTAKGTSVESARTRLQSQWIETWHFRMVAGQTSGQAQSLHNPPRTENVDGVPMESLNNIPYHRSGTRLPQSSDSMSPPAPSLKMPSQVTIIISALAHNGPPGSDDKLKEIERKRMPSNTTIWTICLCFLVFALPYIIIDRLTGFRKNESSWSQRAWMMAWLSADQLSCSCTLPDEDENDDDDDLLRPLRSKIPWLAREASQPADNHLPSRQEESSTQICTYIVLMVAAVGGFVTLVRMYLQDHGYGAGLPLCD